MCSKIQVCQKKNLRLDDWQQRLLPLQKYPIPHWPFKQVPLASWPPGQSYLEKKFVSDNKRRRLKVVTCTINWCGCNWVRTAQTSTTAIISITTSTSYARCNCQPVVWTQWHCNCRWATIITEGIASVSQIASVVWETSADRSCTVETKCIQFAFHSWVYCKKCLKTTTSITNWLPKRRKVISYH